MRVEHIHGFLMRGETTPNLQLTKLQAWSGFRTT